MKKSLLILCTLSLFACNGKKAPDDSTVIIRNEGLYLPPEYELLAPEKVTSIAENKISASEKSKKLLIGTSKNSKKTKENSWIIKKAGGNNRIKNIKSVLEDDMLKAESK